MTTLNISLPDSMRTFIDQKVAQGGYSIASEYIRQLVTKTRNGWGKKSGWKSC